jgi:two-component system phosphate regulon sensor histidine kinase PhoR
MRKRIFYSICFACIITLLLTATLVISVIYKNSTREVKKGVINQTIFIGKAIELDPDDYIQYINTVGKESENRISLISPDGTVVYDSYVSAEKLKNHYDRPEIKSAILEGRGEATRLSDTLGEKTYYYAVKLENGNILRVAATGKSALGIIKSASIWIVLIVIAILFLSVIIARFITKLIIKPINNLDLDDPLSNITYDELTPLLLRLEKQNQKISSQVKELTTQQEEFEYITGAMNEGLVLMGQNGIVLFENNSAKRILGDAVGKSYLELYRDVNYIKAVDSALEGKPSSVKLNKDGRVYELSVNPIVGKSNAYDAVLFLVDITDREQGERMRREFTANVSHELKTPLTSIMGYAEIIEKGIAQEVDIPRFANRIHAEAYRLLALIEDIMKLSRMDEGKLYEEFEQVNLSSLCKSIIDMLYEKANTRNIKISYSGETTYVYGIRSILYEMIYNLCDNAIIYNRDGGSITVKIENENNRTKLTVCDTGIGIPREHHNRIFERFYRVDKSHSKDTGGTGLGLAIVKHGAKLHGADIALESQEGKGTAITITFPGI